MQVVVLGMHRSGTSVLTHLLARLGCHVGPAEGLHPGDAANPEGYWESRAAWALDEEALAALGASWWEVADLHLGALPAVDRQRFEARAREVVAALDAHRPWALKDPRMCVLLPLWRPALSAPVFLLVSRDPLEVARSLQARDGFPIAVGLALWEVYTLAALRHSLGAPRVAVSYRRLLADPAAFAGELLAALDPFAPGALQRPSAAELTEVVHPDLHRQRARGGEARDYLGPRQQALFAALEDGSALAWAEVPPPSPGALQLLRWFSPAERERLDLRRRSAAAEDELSWRRARDEELLRWNDDLRRALAEAQAELAALQQRVAAEQAELAALHQRVAEVSRHDEEVTMRLGGAEQELARLRRRDSEISQWNDSLTASLGAAEERVRQVGELLAGAGARLGEGEGLLGDALGYADSVALRAAALEQLVDAILRSTAFRLGRGLTAPWRPPLAGVHGHLHALRLGAERLAEARRAITERVAEWRRAPAATAPERPAAPDE